MNEPSSSLSTLTTLLDGIADFAYLKDTSGRYLAMNAAAAHYIGRTPSETIGQDDYALFPADHAERMLRDDRTLYASGLESMTFEEELSLDGDTRCFQTIKTLCRDAGGNVTGLVGIARDITERKGLERQLEQRGRQLEQRSRELSEAHRIARIGTWSWDSRTDKTSWSDETFRIFGLDAALAEPGYAQIQAAHTAHGRALLAASVERALSEGTPYEHDVEIVGPDGSIRWITARGEPEEWQDGKVVKLRGTLHEITGRKRTEQALRESEGRYRKLFESNLIGICIPDRFGAFKESNDELLRMTGYTREDLEAGLVRWDIMTPPEYTELDAAHIAEAAERGSCTAYEKEYIRKDGSRLPILCGYALLEDSEDDYIGFVVDLSPQKRMEEALRRSEKLATAGRLAASIAHEINNPLEAVTNSLYLALIDPNLTAETRGFLKMADEELARVAHITTQSLRFHKQSKFSAPADLGEIMDTVLTLFASRLKARQIAVQREFEPGARIDCFSDELRQVFANLVSNSLDATAQGGSIRVRIERTCAWDAARTPGVRVLVADTGCGIPKEMRQRIFEPFFSTKDATGLGLGLWVSDGILRKHNARMTIRSRTDHLHGTVIALFFPHASSVPC